MKNPEQNSLDIIKVVSEESSLGYVIINYYDYLRDPRKYKIYDPNAPKKEVKSEPKPEPELEIKPEVNDKAKVVHEEPKFKRPIGKRNTLDI